MSAMGGVEAIARRFIDRDDWRAARKSFDRRVAADPGDALSLAYRGFFRVKDSGYDVHGGLRDIRTALRLAPSLGKVHAFKAVVLGMLKRKKASLAAWRSAERFGASRADLEWANACMRLDWLQNREAIRGFRRLYSLAPTSTNALLLSQASGQRNDHHAALAWARRARARDPSDFRTWTYAGIALFAQRRFTEAGAELRRAVRLNARYALSHHALACVYLKQGRSEKARRAFEAALRADPLYVMSHKMLGDLDAASGRVRSARRHYRRVLRLFPDFREAAAGLRASRLGETGRKRAL